MAKKPFGLNFLHELEQAEQMAINGGRHHHHKHKAPAPTPAPPPGKFHTMMASFITATGQVIGDQ